jgi:hypothetical protein
MQKREYSYGAMMYASMAFAHVFAADPTTFIPCHEMKQGTRNSFAWFGYTSASSS